MQYIKAKRLIESLKTIPDFRVDIGKIKYPLNEVLFMVIFALQKVIPNLKIYGDG